MYKILYIRTPSPPILNNKSNQISSKPSETTRASCQILLCRY